MDEREQDAENRAAALTAAMEARVKFACAVSDAIARGRTPGQVICEILDDLAAGMPEVAHWSERLREDARFWAETALEAELVAYVTAGIDALADRKLSAKANRRLLVSAFRAETDEGRKAFLARVDPRGVFQGRAA